MVGTWEPVWQLSLLAATTDDLLTSSGTAEPQKAWVAPFLGPMSMDELGPLGPWSWA